MCQINEFFLKKKQVKISHTLSELSTGRATDVGKLNLFQVFECPSFHSASSAADYQHGQQAMSLFTGAVVHGSQFSLRADDVVSSGAARQEGTS